MSPLRTHFVRWFFADFKRPWVEWLETALFTLGALGLGWWFNPANPYYAHTAFPWPTLATVLLALRYGIGAGLLSATLMVAIYAGGAGRFFPPIADSKVFFLGFLLLTLLCAEFSGAWRTRLRRRDELSYFIDERLEQITRRFYLLRLSHERLEQSLLSRPVSLRDGLIKLRALADQQGAEALPGVDAFLELAAQYCQVEQGAVYQVRDGVLAQEPAAWLGEQSALDPDDPLIRQVLDSGQLCHLQMNHMREGNSRYLIAAPIRPANQPLLGLLLVERLPFVALHSETVQILAVLCGYYGDLVHDVKSLEKEAGQVVPGCPSDFAAELLRLHRLNREVGMTSALVALRFGPHPRRMDIFRQIVRQRRTLDNQWEIMGEDRLVLITLMPLSAEAAVEGYLNRIDAWLGQHYGQGMIGLDISAHSRLLGEESARHTLMTLLHECGCAGETPT
ncbi:MAG: PelD GGDEF domain-containing protein [Pseudomonadota bacterium]